MEKKSEKLTELWKKKNSGLVRKNQVRYKNKKAWKIHTGSLMKQKKVQKMQNKKESESIDCKNISDRMTTEWDKLIHSKSKIIFLPEGHLPGNTRQSPPSPGVVGAGVSGAHHCCCLSRWPGSLHCPTTPV